MNGATWIAQFPWQQVCGLGVEKTPCHSKAIVRAPWFTEEWWEGEEHEVEEFGSGGRIKARMKGMGNDPPEDHSIALRIVYYYA